MVYKIEMRLQLHGDVAVFTCELNEPQDALSLFDDMDFYYEGCQIRPGKTIYRNSERIGRDELLRDAEKQAGIPSEDTT
jgi:hypothetical protein